MSRPALALMVARAIVRVYPRWLREAHGAEMLLVLEHRYERERRRRSPFMAGLAVVGLVLRDAVETLPVAWGGAGLARIAHRLIRPIDYTREWIMHEFRHALRYLWRAPRFAFITIATLALGIGAATGVFSVINGVLLRPLPYPDAGRLVRITHPVPGMGADQEWGMSVAGYFRFAGGARTLGSLGAYLYTELSIAGGEQTPERRAGVMVSTSLLTMLGATPELGRLFNEAEERPGGGQVVIISHDLWQSRFGGDPAVLGRTILVNGFDREIAGVLREGFTLPEDRPDVFLPFVLDPAARAVNSHYLSVVGRLAAGMSLSEAQSELATLTEGFREAFPEAYNQEFYDQFGFTVLVRDLKDSVVGDFRATLYVLFAGVALLLVMACANVANLFIVRAEARRREVVLRTVLGATRGQLGRMFICESAIVGGVAGILGLLLAGLSIDVLLATAPQSLPRLDQVSPGWTGAAFALGLALVTAAIFGMVPLIGESTAGAEQLAAGGSRSTTSDRAHARGRQVLVVAQTAMALVLLSTSVILIRSFLKLRAVEPGFEPGGALAVDITIPGASYRTPEAAAAFWMQLLDRLGAQPGVGAAGVTSWLPMGGGGLCFPVIPQDRSRMDAAAVPPCPSVAVVSPGYFEAMGMTVTDGRAFTRSDADQRAATMVMSASLARAFWPDGSAVGEAAAAYTEAGPYYEVVGTVADVRYRGLDHPIEPVAYIPLLAVENGPSWGARRSGTLVIRAAGDLDPAALTATVRREVRAIDPVVPLGEVRTLERVIETSMARNTLAATLFGVAAGMALLLGLVGIYGVVSYTVSRRTQEIGIRMALGARTEQIRGLVLGESLRLAIPGALIGVGGAFAASGALRSIVFEINAADPVVIGGVALALLLVSLAASYLPARRASAVDPALTMRAE